jgi:hypothetical protein
MPLPHPFLGRPEQAASLRLVEVADGPGRGVRLLLGLTAAGLSFEIAVDRGFDISDARLRGRSLCYHGPGGLRAPGLTPPRGAESWLRGFTGGLLMTGGLDHVGAAAEDDAARFAYPGRTSESFPLHGRLTHEPARLVGHGHDDGLLWAEGEIRQAMLYGEALVLRRRIEAPEDGTALRLVDRIENRGAAPSPLMMLYHCNLGWPLLSPGGRIAVRTVAERPVGDWDGAGWREVPPPAEGFLEEVMELRPAAEGDRATATLQNGERDLALSLEWDAGAMPWLFAWRQFAPGTYVLGLEPSTVPALPRAEARAAAPVLAPGESRTHRLSFAATETRGR